MSGNAGKTEQLTLLTDSGPGEEPSPELKAWALVELFGHQRIVGFVSEKVLGNAVMVRVDVPDLKKNGKVVRVGFTRYFGPSAIYSITPVTEDIVRKLLPSIDGVPIEARPLSARSYRSEDEGYE